MADNKISILVTAQDQASPALKKVQGSLDETGAHVEKQSTLMKRLSKNWSTFAGISVAAGFALRGVVGQMSESVQASNDLQASLIGLSSIADHFGQDANAAKRAAQQLANDGLMTVADSATGLKNLLAAGFNLPQAIKLMERFKDSAAFNRQASLGFGDAIRSATEGIKNGNSILVDNAGVTKNLSVMLTEAGFSAQDLMKATTDANVRQAIFNGIIKETNAQVGDAAKLTGSAAGKQAQMAAETVKLHQQIGLALQPALLAFLRTVTPIIQNISQWVQEHKDLTSAIIIGTGVVLSMVASVGALATVIKSTRVVMSVFGPSVARSLAPATASLGRAGLAGGARLATTALAGSGGLLGVLGPIALGVGAVAIAAGGAYLVYKHLTKQTLDYGAATKGVSEPVTFLSLAQEDLRRKTQAVDDATKELKRSQDNITTTHEAAKTATQNVATAQENVNTALANFGINSPQYQAALDNLKGKQDDYNLSLLTEWSNSVTVQANEDKLREKRGLLAQSTDELNRLQKILNDGLDSGTTIVASWGNTALQQVAGIDTLQQHISNVVSSFGDLVHGVQVQQPILSKYFQGLGSTVDRLHGQSEKLNSSLQHAGVGLQVGSGSGLQGGHALGTNFSPGGRRWVGENGPEILDVPQGSRVTPAWQSRGQASAGDTYITISGNITIESPEAAESFWNRVDKTQRLAAVGMA